MRKTLAMAAAAACLMMASCASFTDTLFGPGAGKAVGDGLAVGSGLQGAYIGLCVTGTNPYCSQYAADVKKGSHAFAVTADDIVRTYEAGGDTQALLATLVADALDLQNLLNDFKSKAKLKGIDPVTIITILETGFQVYAQVVPLIQEMKNGASNAQLDALVQVIKDQDQQIQES